MLAAFRKVDLDSTYNPPMRVPLGLVLLPLAIQQLPPSPAPVFRSGTRLVQVNVVVHDKRGQPVADLAKADFTLLENGKPQEISFFSVDSVKAGAAAAPARPLPSRTFTNALAAHNNVPTSVTVLLIDTLNTTVADQMRARAGLLTFLQQLQPQDRIAIFAMTPHGLALLHDFTSDSASLVERLHAAKPQVSPALETSFANATLQQDLHNMGLDALTDGEQVAADFETGNRITLSVTAMLAIAEHLAGVPGRKSLIWVSSGFPMTIGLTDMKAAPARGPARDVQLYAGDLDRLSRAMTRRASRSIPSTREASSTRGSPTPRRAPRHAGTRCRISPPRTPTRARCSSWPTRPAGASPTARTTSAGRCGARSTTAR
jgi:VWFA-related protein